MLKNLSKNSVLVALFGAGITVGLPAHAAIDWTSMTTSMVTTDISVIMLAAGALMISIGMIALGIMKARRILGI